MTEIEVGISIKLDGLADRLYDLIQCLDLFTGTEFVVLSYITKVFLDFEEDRGWFKKFQYRKGAIMDRYLVRSFKSEEEMKESLNEVTAILNQSYAHYENPIYILALNFMNYIAHDDDEFNQVLDMMEGYPFAFPDGTYTNVEKKRKEQVEGMFY